jgi:hypothetical protein
MLPFLICNSDEKLPGVIQYKEVENYKNMWFRTVTDPSL